MDKNKKIGLAIGILAFALIIILGFSFGGSKANADEKDYNTIKEELKSELKTEYDAKIIELENKVTELNIKLDTKEAELKKIIEDGDRAVESKITYDTAAKNREEDKKKNPDKYPVVIPEDEVESNNTSKIEN